MVATKVEVTMTAPMVSELDVVLNGLKQLVQETQDFASYVLLD